MRRGLGLHGGRGQPGLTLLQGILEAHMSLELPVQTLVDLERARESERERERERKKERERFGNLKTQ